MAIAMSALTLAMPALPLRALAEVTRTAQAVEANVGRES
jgi:hypothetical protein